MAEITENLKREYRTVQVAGPTNMLDKKAVQYYAFQVNMYELVSFIEETNNSGYMELLTSVNWNEIEPYSDKVETLQEEYC